MGADVSAESHSNIYAPNHQQMSKSPCWSHAIVMFWLWQFHTDEQGKDKRTAYAQITLEISKPSWRSAASRQATSTMGNLFDFAERAFKAQKWEANSGCFGLISTRPLSRLMKFARLVSVLMAGLITKPTQKSATQISKMPHLIPLNKHCPGADWVLYLKDFNDNLSQRIIPDRANETTGQLCYLPNVANTTTARAARCGFSLTALKWLMSWKPNARR